MKHAILITAYANIDFLSETVDYVNDDRFSIFIHVDKKSYIAKDVIDVLKSKPNVKFVSEEFQVYWGGVNHLKAILLLLEEAFKDNDIDYFHLITEQDFPVKTPDEIDNFISENEGCEFLEFFSLPTPSWQDGGLNRILYYNFFDKFDLRKRSRFKRMEKFVNLQKFLNIKRPLSSCFPKLLYGGSTYWSLSRNAIQYVINFMRENPLYLERFDYTFCSEEIFFQTLLLNSPLKDNIVNNNKRYILWEYKNGAGPAVLDESDYENIIASDVLFARKLNNKYSKKLLNMLKEKSK